MPTRTTIVTLARSWLGTPYHHQASLRGVGTDCVGLVCGIWRELYGTEPEQLPAYTRDWAEAQARETLLEAARRHLIEVPHSQARPGDILIFRWRHNAPAKHCAVLASAAAPALPACEGKAGVRGSMELARRSTMIHAMEGVPVSEVSLSPWWRRHLAGVFAFPGLDTEPNLQFAARRSRNSQIH